MVTKTNFDMDDDATLDFPFDWRGLTHGVVGAESDWLAVGEQITGAVITIEPEGSLQLLEPVTIADGRVVAWLTGGIVGVTYEVSCRITTDNVPARVDERTIHISVKER